MSDLDYVDTLHLAQFGAENLDRLNTIALLTKLREIYPEEPPDAVFCFSSSPFLAYRCHYLCSLAFGASPPVNYLEVGQGSAILGLGKVTSQLELSRVTNVLWKDFRFFGKTSQTRSENQYVAAYVLFKAALNIPVFKATVEEFLEKLLGIGESKGRARQLWDFCIKNGLASQRPSVIVNKADKIVHAVILVPTEIGISWALLKSLIPLERVDKETTDEIFETLDNRGSLVERDPVLMLCPIAKENRFVFSLYTMNFIDSLDTFVPNAPGPCPFIDVRMEEDRAKEMIRENLNESEQPDERAQRAWNIFRIAMASRSSRGKLFIFTSSPNDSRSPYRETPDRILERFEREEFSFDEPCPYRYKDLCMVQSPPSVLLPLKEAIPEELYRLKFGAVPSKRKMARK